jgi:release factor glutamine methyltransferase
MNAAAEVLVLAGFKPDDARRDASVLARHCLGWTLADWAARNREDASVDVGERLLGLARRRAAREPVAYVTGVREFYGRDFRVTSAVLIPRPETEGLVEQAIGILETTGTTDDENGERRTTGPVIVDIGTGSGCVAITLALECPSATVIASDVSAEALAIAEVNAQALGATEVRFMLASLLPAGLPPLDMIVSNPPYVPQRHRASLPADVREFEPGVALFGGEDGLDLIRGVAQAARRSLKPGGWLVMEIGDGQGDAVSEVIVQSGLRLDRVEPDLQDISRVVVAQQPALAS